MNISYYSLSPCLFLLLPTSSPSLPLPTLPPFLATFPRHLSSPPHLATPSRHTISPHHLTTPPHPATSPNLLITHLSSAFFPTSLISREQDWPFCSRPASVHYSLVLSCLAGIRNAFFTPICLSVFISGLKTPFSIPFCRQPTAEGLLKGVRPSAAEWHYTSLEPHLCAEGLALFGRPSAISRRPSALNLLAGFLRSLWNRNGGFVPGKDNRGDNRNRIGLFVPGRRFFNLLRNKTICFVPESLLTHLPGNKIGLFVPCRPLSILPWIFPVSSGSEMPLSLPFASLSSFLA